MPLDDVKLMLGELRGEMNARWDAQDKVLEEIRIQVRATNGRVTALELDSARTEAAKSALKIQREESGKNIKWWVGTLIAGAGFVLAVAAYVIGSVG